MAAVFFVIAVMIVAINIFNYREVATYGDRLLDVVVNNREFFDRPNMEDAPPEFDDGFFNRPKTPEMAYETRFFVVNYYNDEVTVDISKIGSVDDNEAKEYAEKALDKDKSRGTIDNFRFRVTRFNDGRVVVAFVDCSKQVATANNFLTISIIVSCVSVLIVGIIVFFVSKKVISPIVKSYERQKQFITDASHELKTPLTIISANNELVEMEYGENQSTHAINKQVVRMNSLVKNMSMLSKIDESSRIEKSEFSLTDTLLDIIDAFRPSTSKNIELDISDNVNINADENLIRQMISILLDNARKYSLTKIKIELSKGAKALLVIRNDASNLNDIELKKVFDRFYRDSMSRASETEGSGIGLSIAKEIVNLHGGEITALSEDNEFVIKVTL